MELVAAASDLAGSLFPRRWLLLSGAVVPALSQGLATMTAALAGSPARFFDPPGSALLVVAFPCLAGFLCPLLFDPGRGLLHRAPRALRPGVAQASAIGLALLAVGPPAYLVWKLEGWGW